MPMPLCRNLLDTLVTHHAGLFIGDGSLAAAFSWLSRLSAIRPWPLPSLVQVLESALAIPADGSVLFFCPGIGI
ncbi:MAG: hypothetical protein MUE49_00510 [Rhodospirillales bacterium]|jgi:hypothetical protein|nr:hypothetical protein [Rhodospirillales bacterium]